MKRLLAISWEMPPLSGPRAVQVTRTMCALARRGWRSRVICFGPRSTRYNQDFHVSPEEQSAGAVRLVRVPSLEERFFFRALWRVAPPVKRLPDEKRVWVSAAVAAARRALAAEPVDVLVSFAQPWSDHLAGFRLHRETGLPWIAHFSDPWVDSPYAVGGAWQRRMWARMERLVIEHATRVLFVNRETADRVMSKYPAEWRARVDVVPQGYDTGAVPPIPAVTPGALRLVYTGRFYDGLRTPAALFRALAAPGLRDRVLLTIVGGAMEPYERLARQLRLDPVVTFAGRQSPPAALASAAAADVLLSIDAPSDGPSLYLPSKLIDYLPLRKPILALTPAHGPSADLVRRLGYPVVDPTDVAAIASALERLIELKDSGSLTASPQHDEVAREYDIDETTRVFERVLEAACRAAA